MLRRWVLAGAQRPVISPVRWLEGDGIGHQGVGTMRRGKVDCRELDRASCVHSDLLEAFFACCHEVLWSGVTAWARNVP